ncbi:hypothetical protein Tco_1245420 [Tanacetum coccineum]
MVISSSPLCKSRPNGKLIYNYIINSLYVRRMILEPGDVARAVPVPETFHEQTNDELTEAEIKQIEADDQAIQTILLSLPKDIYTDCTTTLTDLRTKFENAFHSEFEERMQNYTRYDAQSFYDAMIFNMDSLRKYMLELILHQQRTPQLLKQKKLIQTQKDHSHPIPALKVDFVVIQNTCSEKEDSNSETASNKLVKECSLNSETKDVHAIKYKMSKAKERCMAYF